MESLYQFLSLPLDEIFGYSLLLHSRKYLREKLLSLMKSRTVYISVSNLREKLLGT
jgi:hypothetical protein